MNYALIGGVTLACGLGSVAVAGHPVIFDNLITNGGFGLAWPDPASQIDTVYPFDAGTADDFFLGPSGGVDDKWQVTSVAWWGGFFGGPPDIIEDLDFVITIWPDAGGVPAGGTDVGNGPDYGQALAQFMIDGNAGQVDSDADGILEYFTPLPGDGFIADPNVTYWLEIQPVFNWPPQWAWQATLGFQGNEAVTGFDLLDIKYWTNPTGTPDVAFKLGGLPIPGPGPAALLAVAAGLGVPRRRRR
ncbi:MAG: hypothetical protein ACYTE6_10410 [Planctomycetota bacterium]|jgi:hypothetical protein